MDLFVGLAYLSHRSNSTEATLDIARQGTDILHGLTYEQRHALLVSAAACLWLMQKLDLETSPSYGYESTISLPQLSCHAGQGGAVRDSEVHAVLSGAEAAQA